MSANTTPTDWQLTKAAFRGAMMAFGLVAFIALLALHFAK
jgi:hypothetical protein